MDKEKLNMRIAVNLLGLELDTRRASGNIHCPICSDGKRKTLNLNFDSAVHGVFRCPKCDISGGALQFWALMRGFTDLTNAAKDYYSFNSDTFSDYQNFKRIEEVDLAPIDIRDKTYRVMMNSLILTEGHEKNLRSRGLSQEDILRNEYKSYSTRYKKPLIQKILKSGCITKGVAGFFEDEDSKKINLKSLPSGILLPQKDPIGRIEGFQLRLDNSGGGIPKYISLSSAGHNKGTGSKCFIHNKNGGNLDTKKIIITEGILKADIIYRETGVPTIALTGVNSQSFVFETLKAYNRLSEVLIAFDMDMYTNIHVEKALRKLIMKVESLGLIHTTLVWDREFKGLDDYLTRKK